MKYLTFKVTDKEKSKDLCSLYTFANVFGDSDFLSPEMMEGWCGLGGMLLSEENAILNLTNGMSLEEQIVDQDGVDISRIKDFIEFPDNDTDAFVYPMRARIGNSSHRFAIVTTMWKRSDDATFFDVHIVDIATSSFAIFNFSSVVYKNTVEQTLVFLRSKYYSIVSVGIFVSDRKPKIFTKQELEHIIW